MRSIRHISLLALFLAMIGALLCVAAGHAAEMNESEATAQVERLLHNQHGLTRLSAADRDAVTQMQATPVAYVKLISPFLTLPSADTDLQDEAVQVHERALTLLGTLGGDQARASILQDYRALTARLQVVHSTTGNPGSTRAGRILSSLRRLALDELGRLGGIEALDDALNDVEAADPATQVVMLRYIARVSAGNGPVLHRLYKIRAQPQSALAKSPALANTIEQLQNTTKTPQTR